MSMKTRLWQKGQCVCDYIHVCICVCKSVCACAIYTPTSKRLLCSADYFRWWVAR